MVIYVMIFLSAIVTIAWWLETKGDDNDGDQENKQYGV